MLNADAQKTFQGAEERGGHAEGDGDQGHPAGRVVRLEPFGERRQHLLPVVRLPECVSIRFWSSLKDMAAQADAVWWSGGRRQKWTGPAWTRESRGNGVWAHGLLAGWGPFEMIVSPHPSSHLILLLHKQLKLI